MATKYAKDQPSGFTNRIDRVAIVGASGLLGNYITQELLKSGNHTITALTRRDSKSKLPDGVKAAPIDYDDQSTIVDALKGQQFLIITMAVFAPPDTHSKLVQAAAKAGVPYVMPNCYGIDCANIPLLKDFASDKVAKDCAEIEATGVSRYIALVCGLWYEYSLNCGPEWFGFDFQKKKVTFFDDGNTKINVGTWEQCARAIAALLSLKEVPEDENDRSPTVSSWGNKPLYISSFLVSQKDMFESWKRVSGDRDEDWTVEYEPSVARYERGHEMGKKGEKMGPIMSRFTRVFYWNGDGNHEAKYGLANDLLGLPKEDLDERTKVAKESIESGYWYGEKYGWTR